MEYDRRKKRINGAFMSLGVKSVDGTGNCVQQGSKMKAVAYLWLLLLGAGSHGGTGFSESASNRRLELQARFRF
jgi:hypothetical protein